ncbi:hypothetical protein H9564_07595 [Limosilactobacillus sp. Sa3CUN2]|uniref:LysR substrate-binding domain-containing protein n=1 Tax=Limosilactobacillus avistercoris TaxID=2762243 RepID=A0ABR8PE57_9LACO|nr:hypothetical protein [Limosilactobacillus avistercoris]
MAALPQEINTFISEEGVEHLVSDVMLGSLDCAIILDNYGFNYDYSKMGLEAIPIHQDKMVMGISERLGQQEKIDLGLIKKMPVAYYSNEDSVYLKHAFINSLRGVVKPLEVLRVNSYEQLQLLVGSGQALSFYPQKLIQCLQRPVERIDYLPLKTNAEQNCEFKLIYKRVSKAPGLKLVRDYFQEN